MMVEEALHATAGDLVERRVEAAARAIYASDEFAPEKPTWDEIAIWMPEAKVHDMYRAMARAALKAAALMDDKGIER